LAERARDKTASIGAVASQRREEVAAVELGIALEKSVLSSSHKRVYF
jgi:hypothetical protein